MKGTGFCPGCGAPTTPLTEICPKCGARVAGKSGSWMPLVAGILDLVLGIPALLGGIELSFASFGGVMLLPLIAWAPGIIGVVMCLLAVVAIVGGIFALRKRRWGLALAGSIIVIVLVIVVVPVMLFFVMPDFMGLYSALGARVPPITMALLRCWVPLCLAGLFLGIPAVVFTALGKEHFK